MLGSAPRGQALSTLSLEPAEDRLARAAFGSHGGSAAARTDAAHLVRRYPIASGGYWLLCYCRPEAHRPPVSMPFAETHSQRLLSTRGLHTSACEAIQEPDVQRSWAPRLCALLGHPCVANDDREADAARLVGTTQQSLATRPIFAPGLMRVPSTLVLPWRGIAPLIAHGVATVGRF